MENKKIGSKGPSESRVTPSRHEKPNIAVKSLSKRVASVANQTLKNFQAVGRRPSFKAEKRSNEKDLTKQLGLQ